MANKDGQYWIDHLDRKVHVSMIDPVDKKQDTVVERTFKKVETLHNKMIAVKQQLMTALDDYLEWERKQAEMERPESGAFTMNNYDQTKKVQVKIPRVINFDNRFQMAETLINEYLNELLEGSAAQVRAIVSEAFQRDKEGKLSAPAVIRLKRINIKDDRWKRAMNLIDESMKIEYAKRYVVLMRRDKGGEWETLKMNFHSM